MKAPNRLTNLRTATAVPGQLDRADSPRGVHTFTVQARSALTAVNDVLTCPATGTRYAVIEQRYVHHHRPGLRHFVVRLVELTGVTAVQRHAGDPDSYGRQTDDLVEVCTGVQTALVGSKTALSDDLPAQGRAYHAQIDLLAFTGERVRPGDQLLYHADGADSPRVCRVQFIQLVATGQQRIRCIAV